MSQGTDGIAHADADAAVSFRVNRSSGECRQIRSEVYDDAKHTQSAIVGTHVCLDNIFVL